VFVAVDHHEEESMIDQVADYGAADCGTGTPDAPACRPRIRDIVRGVEAEPGLYGIVSHAIEGGYLRLTLYRDGGTYVGSVLDHPDGLWLCYRPGVGGRAEALEAVGGELDPPE
jgi:hypothetical protein